MNTCPDKETIAGWLACDLPTDEFVSVGRHVEGCRRCRDMALSLPELAGAAGELRRSLEAGPGRTEECLSYSELMSHMEGSLPGDRSQKAQAHLAECTECRGDLDSLTEFHGSQAEKQRREFGPARSRPESPSRPGLGVETRTRLRRLVPAFGAIAVLIVVVVAYGVLFGGPVSLIPGRPLLRGDDAQEFRIISPDPERSVVHDPQPLFRWREYQPPDNVVYRAELIEEVDPSAEYPLGMKPVVDPVLTTDTSIKFDVKLHERPRYQFTVTVRIGASEPRRIGPSDSVYFRYVD